MIRQTIIPLATVTFLAIVLAGCATPRNVVGEPTPKEEGAPAVAPAEAAAPAASSPAEAPPPPAQTATAPPPAAPPPSGGMSPAQFVPSSKPQIVARIEKVQFPAWVERGGIRASIKAGWAIYTSDHLRTGPEGRLELAIPGEGRIKVSGDADIEMTQAYEFTGNLEPSLLTLHRGTISFSGPIVRAGLPGTLVELGGQISANVLGGQLVARVDNEETLVALVDAAVQVSGPKLNPGTMREPGTFLRVPTVGKAQPVSKGADERMARWLSATEPVSAKPTLSADGNWDVSLNSGYSLKQLEEMSCRIQKKGYPSEIYPVKEPGKLTWYRVVVRRFASKNDAVNFMNTAKSLGSKEPWVLVPQS